MAFSQITLSALVVGDFFVAPNSRVYVAGLTDAPDVNDFVVQLAQELHQVRVGSLRNRIAMVQYLTEQIDSKQKLMNVLNADLPRLQGGDSEF